MLLFGLEYSSSEVSVLFHDIRFVVELAVEVAVVLRGGGGGLLSDDELDEASDCCPREEEVRPGKYDLTSGREL